VFDTLAHLDQQQITIIPHTTSGASPTLNVDSLGAKPIRASTGVSLATGALVQGTPYRFTYYNTAGDFILHDGVAAIPGNFSIGGTLTVTGQATFNGGFANPATLRNASNLDIDALTTHGDSAYAIVATDRVVATSAAFTASRIWTLPAANTVNPGQSLTISDEANGITSTNTLVVSRAGSDTIVAQGTNVSTITLASAGALIALISDGSSKWIVQNVRQAPQVSVFTSGISQTYTTPAGVLYLKLRMCGGGGGGGAMTANAGQIGGDTSFGTWTAIHGNGGPVAGTAQGAAGGTGGVNGTGTVITRVDGGNGGGGTNAGGAPPGYGGSNPFGGAGAQNNSATNGVGQNAKANTGGGGSGAGNNTGAGGGGGAGEYLEALIAAPAATYTYTVGAGGNGGAAGGTAGGAGAAGRIEVTAYFQ
jgi:hypothetical protein